MKITKKDVDYMASLSRLILSESEKEKFTHDLDEMLNYMDKLNELNTQDVEPTVHVFKMKNVFREDKVGPSTDRDEMLFNAPKSEDGCFKVPRIVE
ncbi:MAG: Asp-tRNA(Asn)/Glu-tRNA(Gln) amidotransferase subunit GatC [Clostridia bacterium]|nr:Asp-tRNA(Asn)/Glu-tRNA(Gln) amidotransferase subunit GatC [Clostridia bacterium]